MHSINFIITACCKYWFRQSSVWAKMFTVNNLVILHCFLQPLPLWFLVFVWLVFLLLFSQINTLCPDFIQNYVNIMYYSITTMSCTYKIILYIWLHSIRMILCCYFLFSNPFSLSFVLFQSIFAIKWYKYDHSIIF